LIPWNEIKIPANYQLGKSGLFYYNAKDKGYVYLCPPMAFTSGFSSLENGEERYILQYTNSRHDIVPTEVAATQLTSREVESLVSIGVGVTPANKLQILKYLVAQRRCISIELSYHSIGWLNACEFGADKLISLNGERDGSLKSEAFDLTPEGTKEGWFSMYDKISDNMALVFAVVAGLSSVLLAPLSDEYSDLRSIIFSLIGNSSTGKTTAALLAVSTSGQTRLAAPGTLMRSFSATPTAIPIMLSGDRGVPIVLDEVSRYRGRSLTDVVYNLAEGTSKARATKEASLKAGTSWQTTIFVTGEHGLLDGTITAENDGLRTRVIEFDSVTWTRSAEEAELVRSVCNQNYGHLLAPFATWILTNRAVVIAEFPKLVDQVKTMMDDSIYRDRLAVKFAVIGMTALAMNKCFPTEFNIDAKKLMAFSVDNSKANWSTNIASRMYSSLIDYLKAHQSQLVIRGITVPHAEVIGQISMVGKCLYVDLYPNSFKTIVIKELHAQSDKIVLAGFKQAGYLRNESDRNTSRVKIQGRRRAVVSILIPSVDQDDFSQRRAFNEEGNLKNANISEAPSTDPLILNQMFNTTEPTDDIDQILDDEVGSNDGKK